MFVFRGAVYREAITPEQKALKRKYLLEQSQAADHIPTFDEVWEELRDSTFVSTEIHHYVDRFWQDASDEEVVAWMQERGIEPRHSLQREIEESRESVSAMLSEQRAEEYVQQEVEELYHESVRVLSSLEGRECWRAVDMPPTIDPATHQGLGVYWSRLEEGAEPYDSWENNYPLVRYRGRIDMQSVDKYGTILANSHLKVGPSEAEVKFHKGAPIWIYDVSWLDYPSLAVQKTVKINDWRWT